MFIKCVAFLLVSNKQELNIHKINRETAVFGDIGVWITSSCIYLGDDASLEGHYVACADRIVVLVGLRVVFFKYK